MVAIMTIAALFAVEVNAQLAPQSIFTFNNKTYAKATTRTDTSAAISLRWYPYIEVATYTSGADSGYIRMDYDAYIGNTWVENVKRDTVRFGDGLGDAGKVQGTTLVHPATAPSLFAGALKFRIRNTFVDPIPTADSVGPLMYYQRVDFRSH